MAVMALEPQTQEDTLLEGFLALETPEGFRAELIDGEIVVTPPPGGPHEHNTAKIISQLTRNSPVELDVSGHKGLAIPSREKDGTPGRLIPDLTIALGEQDLYGEATSWMSPEGVVMVVEVTSTRAERDREEKRRCYARAKIAHYLLVDRGQQVVTLFSEPEDGDYHATVWVPYGKALALPEPFDFELDTSRFI
ncbi:Uma2 family endonuclease [Actinomadura sp. 9N407]|uniref:Uma2 family endonuclease n=1 Tax=Actinomadura sp. 9N407 TaxID=3375154 RepID=UPI00379418CA